MISLAEAPRTTDALRAFRSTIRAFVQTEFVPHQDRWREQRFPDPDAWTKAGAAGTRSGWRRRGAEVRNGLGPTPDAVTAGARRRLELGEEAIVRVAPVLLIPAQPVSE